MRRCTKILLFRSISQNCQFIVRPRLNDDLVPDSRSLKKIKHVFYSFFLRKKWWYTRSIRIWFMAGDDASSSMKSWLNEISYKKLNASTASSTRSKSFGLILEIAEKYQNGDIFLFKCNCFGSLSLTSTRLFLEFFFFFLDVIAKKCFTFDWIYSSTRIIYNCDCSAKQMHHKIQKIPR